MKFIVIMIYSFFLLQYECVSFSFEQPDSAMIQIKCNRDNVRVLVDSTFVGITPLQPFNISHGKHSISFIPPENNIWLNNIICKTIIVSSTDSIKMDVTFPSVYYINTEPYGAFVKMNDSIVGTTPLRMETNGEKNVIQLVKDGYSDVIIPLPSGGGVINHRMELLNDKIKKISSHKLVGDEKNYLPHYIAIGTAVAAGSAAAYFKIKADKYYKEYNRTADRIMLKKMERLDFAAGISLGVSEISLIIVSYLLFSQ